VAGAAHHLILVRAGDPESSGSIGCCCRVGRDDIRWNRAGPSAAQADPAMVRFGELYRALRAAFGGRVEITVLDPRNLLSLLSLVARDAVRFRVPPRDVLRALGATSLAAGVLDGRLLYSGRAPSTAELVERVASRVGPAAQPSPRG
jgi:hypothetical protein